MLLSLTVDDPGLLVRVVRVQVGSAEGLRADGGNGRRNEDAALSA